MTNLAAQALGSLGGSKNTPAQLKARNKNLRKALAAKRTKKPSR